MYFIKKYSLPKNCLRCLWTASVYLFIFAACQRYKYNFSIAPIADYNQYDFVALPGLTHKFEWFTMLCPHESCKHFIEIQLNQPYFYHGSLLSSRASQFIFSRRERGD